jgi:CHAD domain
VKARRVKKLEPRESLAENAARIVVVRLDEMRSLAPKALKPEGVKQQHDMRIAAKRLRYVLEATEFCFSRTGEVARRRARDLQGILGELHDCDVMLPRVERHLADLRDADADAVRGRAAEADDLDPALAARAPHRTSYRGLEILMVYLQARRRLLFDRFREFWTEQERAGSWDRLERSAQRRLEEARERRRAAKRAERARRELEEAERAERQAALRAAAAAEELRRARRTAGPQTTPTTLHRQPAPPPQHQPAAQPQRPVTPPPRPPAGVEDHERERSNGGEVSRGDGG